MDFGFAAHDLTKITRQITLPMLSADPSRPITLTVRYAGEGNRDHENAQFRVIAARPKDFARPKPFAEQPQPINPDAALAAQQAFELRLRQETAQIYATAVIVDWQNVFDGTTPVPFSAASAQQLVEQMLEYAPDIWAEQVRNYVQTRSNFRSDPPPNAADLGKG